MVNEMDGGREDSPQELSATQIEVLSAMLGGATQRKAAQAAGIAPETVSRWLASDAHFVAVWNRERRELWDERKGRGYDLADKALETISEILTASDDDGVRLRAALAVLRTVKLDSVGRRGRRIQLGSCAAGP